MENLYLMCSPQSGRQVRNGFHSFISAGAHLGKREGGEKKGGEVIAMLISQLS